MSVDTMNEKVKELRELRRMQDELTAEIEAIQDELKAHMDTHGMDTLLGFDWRITWKPVTSNRLDSTALKKELPDIAARFMKQNTVKRFVLARERPLASAPTKARCRGPRRPPGGGQVQCTTAPSRLQGGNNRQWEPLRKSGSTSRTAKPPAMGNMMPLSRK